MRRFSAKDIEAASHEIDPVFLNSPQFESEPLSDELGCRVVLKVEVMNPIRCFKGRGADLLIGSLKENSVVCASAGNFGQAVAYASRRRGVAATVFAAVGANQLKIDRMRALGANVIIEGQDFDDAKHSARDYAGRNGQRFVEDGFDVETAIGAGTIGLELSTAGYEMDAAVIPLGNGALFNGVSTYIKHRFPQTQMIAVQAGGAPAMLESWKSGSVVVRESVETIADGIAVRVPIEQALNDMDSLIDDGVLVEEDSILRAMRLLHENAGLVAEPAGAVGIAAVLEDRERFQGKTVATVVCGSNLTAEQIGKWLLKGESE